MVKRVKILLIFFVFVVIFTNILYLPSNSDDKYPEDNNTQNLQNSASLEGAENILITKINRIANISGYGLFSIEDDITVKNLNNNPINSIFIAVPLNISDKLIFFEAIGEDKNTLLTERSYMIMDDYEMIAIYFSSPILPQQERKITFHQNYKDLLIYRQEGENQYILFRGIVYPLLPYKLEKSIIVKFNLPKGAESIEGGWGFEHHDSYFIQYDFNYISTITTDRYISPFLENMRTARVIDIIFFKNEITKMRVEDINREIFISPWGIIRVVEELTVKNLGSIVVSTISLKLPRYAKEVHISDDIGEILGVSIENLGNLPYKQLTINLLQNRVRLTPGSSFQFKIRYYLPFEKYSSINWLQESIEIDIFTTSYDYLGTQQSIKIKIEGCYNVDSITEPPDSIIKSQGSTTLFFSFNTVSPSESRIIQFTFTIDFFDLLLRPILLVLLISLIASVFIFSTKIRKRDEGTPILKTEFIPINEIREFCALFEDKNASILEIRQAEEDAKRKKIAKKNLKNILSKNTVKIDEIQKEIIPFKKVLIETGEIFDNIVKRLDILEAERISIKDSLNLLESRYKRGRLPSRAAYVKLSDDFKKRRKKIDRTIDKFLQQLRSYLL
ncbi:MAG: hypothetical protein ACXABO_08610 [Promethearchaeota archaeon]|jgi:hypothetical protein